LFAPEAYLLLCVFLLKLLYPAFSVDDLLLACIKRMALGAYVNMYILSCRSRGDRFAAGADNPYFFVLRMNFCFQFSPPENNMFILIDFARFWQQVQKKQERETERSHYRIPALAAVPEKGHLLDFLNRILYSCCMRAETTDFLIIGSGVAGLRAAIELAPYGSVLVVTKDRPSESCTEYAQGGIAAVMSDEDQVGIHFEDTLKAGDGLCSEEAVKTLVEEGPDRITELISWGAEFDREGLKLALTLEAAHSRRRILHAHGDSTGKELERVLLTKVRSFPSVKKYPFALTIDLIIHDSECHGAFVLREGEVTALFAKATILATGGAGQIYSRTTNPQVATGDGMAIAFRAGGELEDMEFVQFHPTSLYSPAAPQFLLSESMRGEGAVLLNIHKKKFMEQYHPMAELAPRDVVSRAIISEMVKTGSNHVYLDLRHMGKDFVKSRFPRIYSTCLQYDIDITEDLIPVSPAAHYIMGGVKTNLDGETNIRGLYAAGEVACTGVHGANRLASNSLLEGLVFGARAGIAALKTPVLPGGLPHYDVDSSSIKDSEEIKRLLRKIMWEKAGIIRCAESLKEAWRRLFPFKDITERNYLTRHELELKNMITVAAIIVKAALTRKGSAGAHYRSDYKERGERWQQHIRWDRSSFKFEQGDPARLMKSK
jgi:L-aspartate oxidase